MDNTPHGTEASLLQRAMAAHYQQAARSGQIARTPSGASSVHEYAGRWYVVLMDDAGVISVYRVRHNGVISLMRRAPKPILAAVRPAA